MAARAWREFPPTPAGGRARAWLGGLLTALAAVGAFVGGSVVLVPGEIAYRVEPATLVVSVRTGIFSSTRRIVRAEIRDVRTVHLTGGVRVVGTELPGHCSGHFRYPGLGDVWQATNCSVDVVLIDLGPGRRPVLASPSDPGRFRADLEAGTASTFSPPSAPSPTWWPIVRILAAFPLVLAAIIPFLFFVAPGRLGYAVAPGVLEVRTWIHRRGFTLAGVTLRRASLRRSMKLAGSAMPGYFTGGFRFEGATVRVYASTLAAGVLLEGASRIFVSPADVEGFIAAACDGGARAQ